MSVVILIILIHVILRPEVTVMMSPVAIRAVIVVIVGPVPVLMTAVVEVTLLSPVVTVLLSSASSCCLVLSPLLVTRLSFSPSLSLPALSPEVLEVVPALLFVSPGRVEGGDGGVGLQPRLLDHPATHEVASPVEAVCAVHSYEAGLWLGTLAHSREEFLHNLFVGHHVTGHEYFSVNQPELLTVPWVIIFLGVGEINYQFQVRHLSFEFLKVPVFILAERNFKCNEPGSFNYSPNVGIIEPTIRNFGHFYR